MVPQLLLKAAKIPPFSRHIYRSISFVRSREFWCCHVRKWS